MRFTRTFLCVLLFKFFTLFTLFTLAGCDNSNRLREYIPIVQKQNGGLTEAPELVTEKHLDNLELVLREQQIKYERLNKTTLYIDSTVDRNMRYELAKYAEQ